MAVEGGDGRRQDDDSAFAFFVGRVAHHGGGGETGDVEGADQIHFDDASEGFEREGAILAHRALGGGEAGAVDDAVELAGERDGGVDIGFARDGAADVGGGIGGLKIEHDGAGAGRLQRGDGGGAEAGGATGDEDGFAGELHGIPIRAYPSVAAKT